MDDLKDEIVAGEQLDLMMVEMFPHFDANDRKRQLYALMTKAKRPIPRPPKIPKEQVRAFIGAPPKRG